ncbi:MULTISPECIES: zf-HC2 domain-containing protein [unclassified Halomonas]|uniref:zf-HC2 domain-containing protein n=1 Tax=unclassified Halomonas TaxID=2609666 RepID=UPI0028884D4C|nr:MULTISPECIES: zf-HC2 domain-containing protein [unclassified Halomonas]MDT0512388.1 hypothetical protein [Halomonas sp. LES1]MDT0591022.1 hypothetical protein [Halomonas sp. PAR8]
MSDHDRGAHDAWLERVAPYLDDELGESARQAMADHLTECALCREELARQSAVKRRLAGLAAGERTAAAAEQRLRGRLVPPATRRAARPLWGWLGWGLAAVQACALAMMLGLPAWQERQGVPMVRDAVADFRQLSTGALPHQASADIAALSRTLSLPLEPLGGPGVEFLGAWPTALQGQPAAALAYRVEARTVVQYVVSGPLFFNRASVREAIARQGRYVAHLGDQAVVGWPGDNAGSLVVGELPPAELERLRL